MKFRVTGENEQTGARMSLEFEAQSKADAERKAAQQGMRVGHCQVIESTGAMQYSGKAPKRAGVVSRIVTIAVGAVVGYLLYVNWSTISGWLGMK